MNYQFDAYTIHLTLNEADISVRAEHRENRRLYEAVLTASDFAGCEAYGGLEAVGKIMSSAFSRVGATVALAASTPSYLDLKFTVLGLVPITLEGRLFAKRRDAGDDLADLKSKVAELEKALAAQTELKRVQEQVAKLQEEAAKVSKVVFLPGCSAPLPTTLSSLTLQEPYHDTDIVHKCSAGCSQKQITYSQIKNNTPLHTMINNNGGYHCPHGYTFTFREYMECIHRPDADFTTNTFTLKGADLSELKCIRGLNTLKVINREVHDIAPLATLVNLQVLTLKCAALTDIACLAPLKHLRELNLEGCTSLVNINALAALPALQKLNIKGTGIINTAAFTNPRLTVEK